MLNLYTPLIVLAFLLSFISCKSSIKILVQICLGVRIKNPNIKECHFTSFHYIITCIFNFLSTAVYKQDAKKSPLRHSLDFGPGFVSSDLKLNAGLRNFSLSEPSIKRNCMTNWNMLSLRSLSDFDSSKTGL